MGILDGISKDYNMVDMNLSEIQEKLTDPEALSTLKELSYITGFVDKPNVENN
jgi:hypothetical protein